MIAINQTNFPHLIYFMESYFNQNYDDSYANLEQAFADYHSLMNAEHESRVIAEFKIIADSDELVAHMNKPAIKDQIADLGGGAYVTGDDVRFLYNYLLKHRRFRTEL
jgi:CdiI immunity protein